MSWPSLSQKKLHDQTNNEKDEDTLKIAAVRQRSLRGAPSARVAGATAPAGSGALAAPERPASRQDHPWLIAVKQALPVYTATHLLYLIATYVVFLFNDPLPRPAQTLIGALIETWHRWDTGHFMTIATHGYIDWWRTAFFPLYPLMIHLFNYLADNPTLAALTVSNLAGFGVLVVLYRLIAEDFDGEQATRTILYYATFPTAFFLAAGYSESLFMLLALLSFYAMRRGRWWQAGLWGCLASLTREAGLALVIPFAYEYLRQHDFQLRRLRLNVLGGLGIPLGIGLFSAYCYLLFHDPLAFSHAERLWDRSLQLPWLAITTTLMDLVQHHNHLDFLTIHRLIDLALLGFILTLVVLAFIGPWRLQRSHLSYALYAAGACLLFLLVPAVGDYPTMSMPRYALAAFPAFVILAAAGKQEVFRIHYLIISVGLLAFSLFQFLLGQWAG
jgi:Gpi18-like mannosyltransferase